MAVDQYSNKAFSLTIKCLSLFFFIYEQNKLQNGRNVAGQHVGAYIAVAITLRFYFVFVVTGT